MTATFPHHYSTTIVRADRSRAVVDAPPRSPIPGGPPPEFDGDPMMWSPEHLLLSALGLCLFTTFEALAHRDTFHVLDWRGQVEGTVDKTPTGLAFISYTVTVEMTVEPGEVARATALLDKAKRFCLVSNALRVPVQVDVHVAEATAAA